MRRHQVLYTRQKTSIARCRGIKRPRWYGLDCFQQQHEPTGVCLWVLLSKDGYVAAKDACNGARDHDGMVSTAFNSSTSPQECVCGFHQVALKDRRTRRLLGRYGDEDCMLTERLVRSVNAAMPHYLSTSVGCSYSKEACTQVSTVVSIRLMVSDPRSIHRSVDVQAGGK